MYMLCLISRNVSGIQDMECPLESTLGKFYIYDTFLDVLL